MIYAFVVVFIFSATSLVFILYDIIVQRRQQSVAKSAANANAIVSNMFPETVQQRLFLHAEDANRTSTTKSSVGFGFGTKKQQKNFVNPGHNDSKMVDGLTAQYTAFSTKPIADLFTEATVLFADISGFTAWSSVREPSQVFTLLETVYASFDKAAKALTVFKVETIGKSQLTSSPPIVANDRDISHFTNNLLRNCKLYDANYRRLLRW